MKQIEQVVVKIAIAVRLSSGVGSVPARSTMISDAHHSEIMRKFGSAKRRKGNHWRSAPLEKPCQDDCRSLRKMLFVLTSIQIIKKKFPNDVEIAAPRKPRGVW